MCPNWCYNSITVKHENPEMIRRLGNAKNGVLQEFIPCPKELYDGVSPAPDDIAEANLEKYGAKDWYDWRVDNWGTKWDIEFDNVFITDNDTCLTSTFDSAWSPPIEAYEKLSDMGFKIEAVYCEPGMSFAGEYTTHDGDYCIEYDFSDDNWRDGMSDELVAMLEADYESWQEWNQEAEAQEA